MIIPLDIQFDYNELLEYYNTLERDYQHLKWTFQDDVEDADKGHKHDGIFGWAIQSNLEDLTKPCPPYDIHKERTKEYRDTELMFGFAKKLTEFFPGVRQLGIAGHPPGVSIAQHVDNDKYYKIHIPIVSNPQAFFTFGPDKNVLAPGKMYYVATEIPHGTINEGDSTRVHMFFKCDYSTIEDVKKMTGTL